MIENNELKINDGSTEKRVNEDVQVGPDDRTSTAEKKRKKISRFYDWFWLFGLLIQLFNIDIFCEFTKREHHDRVLTSGIIILATYTFTWMLSKRKRNVFTDIIWTISYSIMIFYAGVSSTVMSPYDNVMILSCIIVFIYWALVWHCTREKSKN